MKQELLIFSDASFCPKLKKACISFLIYHPQGFYTGATKLIRARDNNAAEVSAIYWAENEAFHFGEASRVTYSDSRNAIKHHIERGNEPSSYLWVKGHSQNLFNNIVDYNARKKLKESRKNAPAIHSTWPLIIPQKYLRFFQ